MTITFPLSLPDSDFAEITLRQMPVGGMNISPYTGTQQAQIWPGQWWEADITLPPMNRAEAAPWMAFFGKLNGVEGSFYLGDPEATSPLGAASASPGTPLVDGVHSAGDQELDISGGPNSVINWLKAGDYIQIGTGASAVLHLNLTDVNTDGTGDTTLTLWPNLTEDLAGGESITLSSPKGVFRLSQSSSEIIKNPSNFHRFNTLTAIQKLV